VSRALNAAGEKTVTTTRTQEDSQLPRSSLLVPVLAMLVFAAMVGAIILL
jgi:hypothetical protein